MERNNNELSYIAIFGAAVAAIAWKAGLLVGLSVIATGCGSSAGWRFEIGVAPVNAINNNYSLNADSETEKKGK